jgi:hypothetical protein
VHGTAELGPIAGRGVKHLVNLQRAINTTSVNSQVNKMCQQEVSANCYATCDAESFVLTIERTHKVRRGSIEGLGAGCARHGCDFGPIGGAASSTLYTCDITSACVARQTQLPPFTCLVRKLLLLLLPLLLNCQDCEAMAV